MKTATSTGAVGAITLIELLCVVAIIGVLAALLLPALNQGQARARQIQCADHLHQIGIGFINFANDHNKGFPMAVPLAAGGSQEFATNGYRLQGDFYFSFRHFQAVSNELVTPRLVACPADTRLPASSFATLNNSSLSYFVGVNAEFARPASLLAGDRNLTNDYASARSLVSLGPNAALRWTGELHRFKGNLLFSDGHVEEKTSPGLLSVLGQLPGVANLALPTSPSGSGTAGFSPGMEASPGLTSSSQTTDSPGTAPSANRAGPNAGVGASQSVRLARSSTRQVLPGSLTSITPEPTPTRPKADKPETNAALTSAPAKPQPSDANPGSFSLWLATLMESLTRKAAWGFYLLLLLIAATALVLRRLAQGKKKRANTPPL
jgi:prepilin-type N-terminal cleavage/methylation domain-containing protein/prepilin-type processing-associated H-X9-DG protein